MAFIYRIGATENAGVGNAIRSTQKCKAMEYVEVEKSGANRGAGKCRSWVAVWEAERLIIYGCFLEMTEKCK